MDNTETNVTENATISKPGVGLGVASMVCGILALLLSCCVPYLPIILAIVAIALGGVGINKNSGKNMAIAGLVCGVVSLIPGILLVAGVLSFATML